MISNRVAAGTAALSFALVLVGCSKGETHAEAPNAAAPTALVSARDAAPPPPVDAGTPEEPMTLAPFDAGPTPCRPLRAPYIDPDFIAPVALRIEEHGTPSAQLIFNESGIPHIVDVPGDARDASAAISASRTRTTLPSCAVAGDAIFCPDASGVVQSWRGEKHAVVAHARPGTDLTAATLGGKVAVAFINDKVSSEGVTREAWIALEGEGAPVRISEDGSGATFVALAPRGHELLAMTIDARVAMTPAHARSISLRGGALEIGPDAVVFVGGSAEPHNAGALVSMKDGTAFELIAVADGATAFGMASIKVEDPPRVDEPVVWSMYPNGLDPAPIAVAVDAAHVIVARVRPRDAVPHARRDLEIGELAKDGTFSASCIVDEAGFIKDVEVALDSKGALWVFYRDPRGSVLERRALPPRR